MAQLAGTRHTYMDTTRREDILDRIVDVSPDSNYLTTTLGTVSVSQTLHQWKEYYEARPTSNSKAPEGDDNTYADLPQPDTFVNVTQIIKETFAVSETDIEVDKVSPKDAYARENANAMRRLKNKMEFAVLRGSYISGSSGVAREMQGIRNFVAANGQYTARVSGTSFSEQEFRDIAQASWEQSDEQLIDLLLCTGTRKTHFSAFFTSAQPKTIAATDKRLVQAVSVIETDFGNIVELRAHKDMVRTNTGGEVLGIKKNLVKLGYLRTPKHVPNSVTGDNRKGHHVTELTVQVDSPRPMVLRSYGGA